MRRSQNGEFFQQYRLVVDMHSVYLVAKEFEGCFKGKFWFSVLLLFYLGHVHTYPEIFFAANIFLRMRKFSRPHAAYSNRVQPSTRLRLYPEIF